MAKAKTYNIFTLQQEVAATSAVLEPALAKAGITTTVISGKTVAISDCSTTIQATALLAAQPVVADSATAAETLVSNERIAALLDEANNNLALKSTAVDSLTRDKATLQGSLTTAQAAVQDLTVKNGVLTTERDAAVAQFGRNAETIKAQNDELSRFCLNFDCLALTSEDGRPLAKDASASDRLAAANRVPFANRLSCAGGAVTAALNRAGISQSALPNAPATGMPAGSTAKPLTGRARMKAHMKIEGGN